MSRSYITCYIEALLFQKVPKRLPPVDNPMLGGVPNAPALDEQNAKKQEIINYVRNHKDYKNI